MTSIDLEQGILRLFPSEWKSHKFVGFRSQSHYARTATPTQYVVNTLYWPHTALSVYRVCYFLVPHTHVLCMGSGSATGKKIQVRLVHSLLKYFFKFQLWYWNQIYTTKYSNLLLIILILVWNVCSTYRKGEILMQKWHVTSQFVYCFFTCHSLGLLVLVLRLSLSGVGVRTARDLSLASEAWADQITRPYR